MKRIEPTTKRISFREALPNAPQAAIDLIQKLMTYDPAERLTAKEVLRHPFLADLYDPLNDDQIVEATPIKYFDFEFE